MTLFEKVSKYADSDIAMPVRKTEKSAGYDMVAAEDYIIPSIWVMFQEAKEIWPVSETEFVTMEQMAKFTKETGCKPTLVSTGMKCKLDKGEWLQLSVRSSSPLKYWLMLGNGIGVIDADYYNNPDNEGARGTAGPQGVAGQRMRVAPFSTARAAEGETGAKRK